MAAVNTQQAYMAIAQPLGITTCGEWYAEKATSSFADSLPAYLTDGNTGQCAYFDGVSGPTTCSGTKLRRLCYCVSTTTSTTTSTFSVTTTSTATTVTATSTTTSTLTSTTTATAATETVTST